MPDESFFHRFRLTIAYVVLVIGVVVALALSLQNQQRIEDESNRLNQRSIENQQRIEYRARVAANENCEAVNEAKAALDNVLQALAAPRDDDKPDEAADRQELYRQLAPLVTQTDCPPLPER